MTPKYPAIRVKLAGREGNAFAVLAHVLRALRAAHVPQEEQDAFGREAMSDDYDHLLRTCMEWVEVE
jgi:hypothetical protein